MRDKLVIKIEINAKKEPKMIKKEYVKPLIALLMLQEGDVLTFSTEPEDEKISGDIFED